MKTISKIQSLSKAGEFILIVSAALLIVGGVMLIWITPFSGWHPVDDHEFLMWTYLMRHEGRSLFDLIAEYNQGNLISGRLRPLYLTMRGIFIWMFGDNIMLYYIWAFIKTWITFILVYYMFRGMGADIIRAWLAVCVSMIGYQSCTWWKLGTHEIVTLAWFAAGMILMMKYLSSGHSRYAVASILSYLIMTLYKESFIVLIPFIILYVIYRDVSADRSPADPPVKDLRGFIRDALRAARSRWIYLSVLFLLFAIPVFIIVFVLGQDYLGEVSGMSPIISGLTGDMKWLVIFGAIMAIIVISRDMESLKVWQEAVLLMVFILPQFYLFRSTGITERYLIPFCIGYAMFFCVMVPARMDLGRIRTRLYYTAMILLILAHCRAVLIEGSYYRYRGQGMTEMMDYVREVSQADPDKKILSCLYYEVAYTIYANNLLGGCDNVYRIIPEWDSYTYEIVPVRYYHYITFESDQPEATSLDDFDVILAYNQQDRHWEYHANEFLGLSDEDYDVRECGTFLIYTRK